jgi:hypothetical protein
MHSSDALGFHNSTPVFQTLSSTRTASLYDIDDRVASPGQAVTNVRRGE